MTKSHHCGAFLLLQCFECTAYSNYDIHLGLPSLFKNILTALLLPSEYRRISYIFLEDLVILCQIEGQG